MEGGKWQDNEIQLTSEPTSKLPQIAIRWIKKEDQKQEINNLVELPVYLNSDRTDLLFTISVPANSNEKDRIPQRAVALVISF